jgi:hypothetical protein
MGTTKVSDELIQEQSRLVSRGVRLLSLIGECPSDPTVMLQTATRIETLADDNVVPFVIDEGSGNAEFGYAASEWVIDLFRWVVTAPDISPLQRNRIAGVLCGYSAEAIRLFEERQSGRLFRSPIVLPSPTST